MIDPASYRAGLEAAARYHRDMAAEWLSHGAKSGAAYHRWCERVAAEHEGHAKEIEALPVPETDDEAMVERLIADMEDLRLALADAIRRPMGVIPESAARFVTAEDLAEAEERRRRRSYHLEG